MAAVLLALVTFAACFDIAVPFITQRLIDTLIGFFQRPEANPLRVLLLSSGAILGATVLTRIVRSVYDYNLFKTVTQIEDTARFKATEKYLSLHALFHHKANSGQIIGRIERGCTGIYIILLDILGQSLVPPVLVLIGVLVSLAMKNFWIALIVFSPLPVYILVVRKLANKIYQIERQVNEQFELVSKEAYDVAGNVLTVKRFSQELAEAVNQKRLLDNARLTQYQAIRLWTILENTQTLISTVGRVSVIVVSGMLVLHHRCTVGEFVLYVTLQAMAYQPIAQLSIMFPRLRREVSRAERLFELLDEHVGVPDKPEAVALPPFRHAIEFQDVCFRYSEDSRWVLRNVNLRVPAGTTVALVGKSGSGKTTFINLLLRAFDPQEGAVRVDGIDVREIKRETLRMQVAVVPQEVDLFSRTVAENISYGRPGATREQIERAGEMALAHDFIMRTERGYETVVGERGVKLSGGERQRIGIARAILRDPRILILDEATSHLDTESEQLIREATDALSQGRTVFIIAHRLSTILNADKIVVFSDSEIEAVGTHDELLSWSPTYRRLYSIQLESAGLEPTHAESQPREIEAEFGAELDDTDLVGSSRIV